MNKKYIFLVLLVIGVILFLLYFFYGNKNTSNKFDYKSSRTSQNIANDTSQETNNSRENINLNDNNKSSEVAKQKNTNSENNENKDTNSENSEHKNTNSENNENKDTDSENNNSPPQTETEIASFSTKIYTKKASRQNNLSIACSTLNNTTVEKGQTFSFSNTVGKATSNKGYQRADVFRNGEVIEALGGGLCQVSTTLYNAVLKIPELKVIERHPHSNKVPYIKSGKDAAVSFGAQDFKFINNAEYTLKIKASNTDNHVTVKLLKIE